MPVTHPFNSAVADGTDATLVRPSNWNAGHTVILTATAEVPVVAPSVIAQALALGGF